MITTQLQNTDNQANTIGQLITAQLKGLTAELFFGIGFTQHIILLNKCKDWSQRLFYIKKTVENHWTVEMLEWQIKTNLFQKQDKTIQSNFKNTLSIPLQLNSTLAFKNEYLLDSR